ncbi:MAG: hypothetical protein N3A54_06575 [Patescibacteria group bacterium]|nr:hypothetical protein [Patescibacteria group bacterium]
MNSSKVIQRILKKPLILIIIPVIYVFIVSLSKWRLNFSFDIILFFIGGIVSIYLIDIAEELVSLNPSPFRSIVFVIGLVITGFYILTSTQEMIASGLVLGLLLNRLLFQISEWKIRKNLHAWYVMHVGDVPTSIQRVGVIVLGVLFFLQTIIFIV